MNVHESKLLFDMFNISKYNTNLKINKKQIFNGNTQELYVYDFLYKDNIINGNKRKLETISSLLENMYSNNTKMFIMTTTISNNTYILLTNLDDIYFLFPSKTKLMDNIVFLDDIDIYYISQYINQYEVFEYKIIPYDTEKLLYFFNGPLVYYSGTDYFEINFNFRFVTNKV